ncbi:MAG: hypothetical protein QM820_37470 [Minicystis sp.]
MGQLDQFAKDTFAIETATVTRGGVEWQLPPELGMSEVRLDGLLRVVDPAPLAALAAPWSLVGQADELVIEIKMPGDHLDLLAFDRALLRRLARQVQRREDPEDGFDGEVPLWLIASHVPAVIEERRPLTAIAPGCYRVGPEWMATVWVAANELPLAGELVPFLVARTGRRLDAFAQWVVERRPTAWLLRMLESLPVSTLTYDDLRFRMQRAEDPEVLERQRGILERLLDLLPEEREKLEGEGKIQEARSALRRVLRARKLALGAEDEARIDACTDLGALERWLEQAVVAASAPEALR